MPYVCKESKNIIMKKIYIHNGKKYTRHAYFNLMFGGEFMNSNDKGKKKTYKVKK